MISNCYFSCIDSRTLNKHMFNKHGRQTPIKTNQMMNGRSPSNLSSMIPSLIGQRGGIQHPMGRDPTVGLGNPFLLNHNRNLINLKAQEQMQETLRNRFSALSAAAQATGQAPNFEQIQFLQEQMAAQLAAKNSQNQENFPKAPNMDFPSDSPFPNAPNTALLAQIAAQMQRIQAQNAQNSAQNTSTGQNSHNTTPEDESLEAQNGGEGETEEKICEITEVNSDNGAKIEEIDASSDTKMDIDRTGSAELNTGSIEETSGKRTTGITEMTIEPTSPDATPTGSPTAAPIKNESTPSNENDLPNHRSTLSGLPENSPIKVPSENSADENGSDTDKPNRKRKLDQSLDYNTMNEAILAQQRFGSSLRGPVPGLPFPYQLPFNVSHTSF